MLAVAESMLAPVADACADALGVFGELGCVAGGGAFVQQCWR